ncbi:HNH endonuclease signature motif containing protein [Tsukamurella soli]|uniref:HNH nuclease domain-containing protein n=1 Tax=Tsukamurella soli TaxID=644556 RepID=A0ABP8K3G8_9ACTN
MTVMDKEIGADSDSSAGFLDALSAVEWSFDSLLAADPTVLSVPELTDALDRVEVLARRLPAVQVVLDGACQEAGVAGEHGFPSLKLLLQRRMRLSGGEAAARVRGVRNRGVRPQPSGAVCPPRFPIIAEAQRRGVVSARQVTVIEKLLDKADRAGLTADSMSLVEDLMVDAALDDDPDALNNAFEYAMSLVDPDGTEPDEKQARRNRSLDLGRQRSDDLTAEIGGVLTADAHEMLQVVFAKWARPGIGNPDDPDSPLDAEGVDEAVLAAAAERDTRSAGQRRHDALVRALRVALESGATGRLRGLPGLPIVTLTVEQVQAALGAELDPTGAPVLGTASTATGGRLPVSVAMRLLAEHPGYAVLLDGNSRPLWLGRTRRLASPDQRIALIAADRGCTAPGCDSAPAYCQTHHMQPWAEGGHTDIENLTLVCSADHGTAVPASAAGRDGSDVSAARAVPGGTGAPAAGSGGRTGGSAAPAGGIGEARGHVTAPVPAGEAYAGRAGWMFTGDLEGQQRVNHRHHPDELYREALARWLRRRDALLAEYRACRPDPRRPRDG